MCGRGRAEASAQAPGLFPLPNRESQPVFFIFAATTDIDTMARGTD